MNEQKKSEILRASKCIHVKIEGLVTARLAHNDITAAQSHVLMFIMKQEGDVYPSDIHRKLHISRATVSGLIKKLRASGYITLKGCENDERQKKIAVTEKALMHKAEIEGCMSGIEEVVFRDFSDEELDTLHRLIFAMADNIRSVNNKEDTV